MNVAKSQHTVEKNTADTSGFDAAFSVAVHATVESSIYTPGTKSNKT